MFIVDCPSCQQQHLVSNLHIESLHKTSHGIVGYVRCAAGHVVLHQFPVTTRPDLAQEVTEDPSSRRAATQH